MSESTPAQTRFRSIVAIIAALAQWPLAAVLMSGADESLTHTDGLGLVTAFLGLMLWLLALRGRAITALALLGSLALTCGAYLCLRDTTLAWWLGFAAVLWL